MYFFIRIISFRFSLGVTPGIHRITFVPLEEYSYGFTVVNSQPVPLTVSFLAQGTLVPYLSIPSALTIEPYSSTTVPYTLALPATLPPGFHDVSILITEQKLTSSGQTSADIALGVLTTIRVFVPYPEPYPVAEVTFNEETSLMKIHVENLGEQDIKEAYATLNIEVTLLLLTSQLFLEQNDEIFLSP